MLHGTVNDVSTFNTKTTNENSKISAYKDKTNHFNTHFEINTEPQKRNFLKKHKKINY
jgi:hypothetical protein